jgi:perosamine synthetase
MFNTAEELETLLIDDGASIRDVLRTIDANGRGLALVVDADRSLRGIITDGDARRGLLRGLSLEEGAGACLNREFVAAPEGASREELLKLMDYRIRCVPILDSRRRPVDFVALEQIYQVPVAEPQLAGRELEYVTECITTNWISSQGKYVDRFEREFAVFVGTRYALATSSGTTALHLALAALGLGPGDEVIVPDLTFIATANAVAYCGATAVLADVDPVTWTLSPSAVESVVTERTKGILPVHLYGHPADMAPLRGIAERHGLFLLEDCAEALGARYRGEMVGQIGEAGCFSFYGNKTLTTGEGGMVVTNDEVLYRRAKVLRDHGMSPDRRYWHPLVGFNYRLTNLQAAVGVAQLERIDTILALKANIDRQYRTHLSGIPGLVMPAAESWADPVCWLFSMRVDSRAGGLTRDELLGLMQRQQIGCRPVFYPLHEQPPYFQAQSFPASEEIARSGISLPSAVTLTDRAVEYVSRTIRRFVADYESQSA